MDKLQNSVSGDVIKECLRGAPFDLSRLNEAQIKRCAIIMVHCCINGPVGVNKPTTFPANLQGSIKELIGIQISNNSWARTCLPFAQYLQDSFPTEVGGCQQMRLHKALWPIWDDKK
jgi:hypothetical protein